MTEPVVIVTLPQRVIKVIVNSKNSLRLVSIGTQGPVGPRGASGTTSNQSGTCGENISAYKVLALRNGLLYHADPTNVEDVSKVIGVSTQSALTGQTVEYVQFGDLSGGVFTANTRYYLGFGGALSTQPVANGAAWRKSIGISKSSSVISLNMGPSILI